MSSAVPGSWPPNWLQGTPRIENPSPLKRSCSSSRPAYCGVKPQREATLTTSVALPLNSERSSWLPSRAAILTSSYTDISYDNTAELLRYSGLRVRRRRRFDASLGKAPFAVFEHQPVDVAADRMNLPGGVAKTFVGHEVGLGFGSVTLDVDQRIAAQVLGAPVGGLDC